MERKRKVKTQTSRPETSEPWGKSMEDIAKERKD